MECFKGHYAEASPAMAISKLFTRLFSNRESWVHIIKIYTILHVALQDPKTMAELAKEIRKRSESLFWYKKKQDDSDYRTSVPEHSFLVEVKHSEISKIYATYVQALAAFITQCNVLELPPAKVSGMIKAKIPKDATLIYERIIPLLKMIITQVSPLYEKE